MSRLANLILSIAKFIANTLGSKLEIRIYNSRVEVKFVKPESTDRRVWRNQFENACFYVKESAAPCVFDINYEKITIRDSDYLEDYITMDAYSRALNPDDGSTNKMEMLMYGTLAGIGVLGFLLMTNM